MHKKLGIASRLTLVLFLISVFSFFDPIFLDRVESIYKIFVYLVIGAFSIIYFGLRLGSIFAFLLSLMIFGLFDYANSIKINAAGMPINPIDIVSTIKFPLGLMKSIGFNGAGFVDAVVQPGLLLLLVIFILNRYGAWRFLFMTVVTAISAFFYIGLIYSHHKPAVIEALYRVISEDEINRYPMWSPVGHANLSIDVGIPAYFLYFNNAVETSQPIIFSEMVNRANPINPIFVNEVVSEMVSPYETDRATPDVFIVHLESTFDPYAVFYLETESESPLFPSSNNKFSETHHEWSSRAIVNTVGGNSWITEFEVVTGIDSRAFGILGRYTHATLAGRMNRTFIKHLKDLGYDASLFTETSRNFFNYGNAYKSYGVDNIYDSEVIKTGGDDVATIESVIDLVDAMNDEQPHFGMILLSENHSPHPCRDDVFVESGFARNLNLDSSADCVLNVFLERAKNTEAAVLALLDYLEQRRINKGRDFILAMYGDHQPFSFTGGGGLHYDSNIDFSPARRGEYDRSVRETYVKIISSLPTQINCCGDGYIPITLVPTIISGMIDPSNIYMDVNLLQQVECGDDAFGYMMAENNFYSDKSDSQIEAFACSSLPSFLAFQQKFAL